MPKKNPPAKKRTVAVRDIKAKGNPKGGITLSTAPTSPAGLKVTCPTLTAKGTDVAIESLTLAKEGLDIT
jgi:hypothetical protein